MPQILYPLFRITAWLVEATASIGRWLAENLYFGPLFRSRCVSVGKRLLLRMLPDITGHPRIVVGDDVCLAGQFSVTSGRTLDEPRLSIGDRVTIGHNVNILVNREVVIEPDVIIAGGCRLMDSDAHPRDPAARRRKLPPPPEEVKPIRICRQARIGGNTFVMKGVTIGEDAVIGVNSVVLSDVPAYAIAAGNPARVIGKNAAPSAAPFSPP